LPMQAPEKMFDILFLSCLSSFKLASAGATGAAVTYGRACVSATIFRDTKMAAVNGRDAIAGVSGAAP